MKTRNIKGYRDGFTLVELAVVIAILSVLALIAIPSIGSSKLTSQVAAHNVNVRLLKSAGIMYLIDNPNAEDIKEEDLKSYFDGEKFPKRTVDVDKNKINNGFVVKIKNGEIVVIPGELKIKKENNNRKVSEILMED